MMMPVVKRGQYLHLEKAMIICLFEGQKYFIFCTSKNGIRYFYLPENVLGAGIRKHNKSSLFHSLPFPPQASFWSALEEQ